MFGRGVFSQNIAIQPYKELFMPNSNYINSSGQISIPVSGGTATVNPSTGLVTLTNNAGVSSALTPKK
jgi:hypothetical protein